MAVFGNITQDATEAQDGGGIVRGSKFTLNDVAGGGIITAINLFCRVTNAGTVKITMAIYSDNGANAPSNKKLVSTETTFTNTSKQVVAAPVNNLFLQNGTYWLVWENDGGTGTGGLFFGESALANGVAFVGNTYPTLPDPFGSPSYQDFNADINATYNSGGADDTAYLM